MLTPQEAQELFGILRALTAQGKSIIFISHKLNEVLEVADRITVLRRGKLVDTLPRGRRDRGGPRTADGRARGAPARREAACALRASRCSQVEGLKVRDDRGLETVRGVSLRGPRAARSSASRASTGTARASSSTRSRACAAPRPAGSLIDGQDVTGETRRHRLDNGLGHIPEDRQRRGLVLEFSLAENLALHDYDKPPDSRLGWLFPRRLLTRARTLLHEFDVRGGGPQTRGGALSGGNQQKVVLAREVDRDPQVLLAAQPTRGLDVGAIEFVHRRLVTERDEGRAILLVSLELDEILSLSDRILVIYEGAIVGEFPPTRPRRRSAWR